MFKNFFFFFKDVKTSIKKKRLKKPKKEFVVVNT